MTLDPANGGVLLHRTGDQARGFQSASVAVDGVNVGTWLQPRANGFARWLGDDFAVPASATSGKSSITITITPDAGAPAWSATRYAVDCLVTPRGDANAPQAPTGLRVLGVAATHCGSRWAEPFDDTAIASYRDLRGDDVERSDRRRTPRRHVAHSWLRARPAAGAHHALLPRRRGRYRRQRGHAVRGVQRADPRGDEQRRRRRQGRPRHVHARRQSGRLRRDLDGQRVHGGTKRHDFFAVGGEIPAIGDFNGDGKDDIVTFTRGDAADVYVALSNGTGFGPGAKWHDYSPSAPRSQLVGDFNGDGLDDIVTFTRGDNADVFVALSNGTSFGPGIKWNDHFAIGTETPAVGDFDGDGRDDIVTFTRGDAADVYVALSDGSRFVGGDFGVTQKWHDYFALDGEIAGTGDFDGDGRDDIVTFTRGTNADVYVAYSNGRSFGPGIKVHDSFAGGAEIPGVGDFNGDGRDDLVTFTRGDYRRRVRLAVDTDRLWTGGEVERLLRGRNRVAATEPAAALAPRLVAQHDDAVLERPRIGELQLERPLDAREHRTARAEHDRHDR